MDLQIGDKAPLFQLADQDSEVRNLADYRGQWVLLYFYPKDNTPGCTKEACSFRDNFEEFKKIRVPVLGVSVDPVVSHKKFEEEFRLPFLLLSDEKKEVVKKYGVWQKKNYMGKEYMGTLRQSFLINPEGKIAKIYANVQPETHAAEVLKDLQEQS